MRFVLALALGCALQCMLCGCLVIHSCILWILEGLLIVVKLKPKGMGSWLWIEWICVWVRGWGMVLVCIGHLSSA